jgi:hypothetical protein
MQGVVELRFGSNLLYIVDAKSPHAGGRGDAVLVDALLNCAALEEPYDKKGPHKLLSAEPGESCDSACSRKGLVCSNAGQLLINSCAWLSANNDCASCFANDDSHGPAAKKLLSGGSECMTSSLSTLRCDKPSEWPVFCMCHL